MTRQQVLDLYFMDARFRLIELAAFLDRVERAEGQADVLAHYGIHEATMGCPIVSSLEVVSVGKTPRPPGTAMIPRRAHIFGSA